MNRELQISQQLETLLVRRNSRGMKEMQAALTPGYLGRAAELIRSARNVFIVTGFPVLQTFETDGPVGAIALYRALEQLQPKPQQLQANPTLVCEAPLATVLQQSYQTIQLAFDENTNEIKKRLQSHQPDLIIAIERPGAAIDGHYYNMRGDDISSRIVPIDAAIEQLHCPIIAIGDGGNELGMGHIYQALQQLDIIPSATRCTELIVADVSNWGAFGLIAMLGWITHQDLLNTLQPQDILHYLSQHGSIDGISLRNELTEDGLPASEGIALIAEMRAVTGFY